MDKKHNCPRGFAWCKIKGKCIPAKTEAKDKLMKRYQRYFFKGDKVMGKVTEGNDLVDIAFEEGFEVFGKIKAAEKKMEKLLDECGGGMMGGGSINKGIADVEPMETEDEYETAYDAMPNDETNDITHEPNQDAEELYKSVRRQIGEIKRLNEDAKAEYKKYFDSMLKKYGVSSPTELDGAKKKEFFDAVDKGWKAKKETD